MESIDSFLASCITHQDWGLTFHLPRFLRQILNLYEFAPHQLATNVYRIISSVVKLKEDHNIPFCMNDLMAVQTVSRSRAYGRYYFTIRPEYPYLINNLWDSERHASELVIVRGNLMWSPEEMEVWPVPWRQGNLFARRSQRGWSRTPTTT